MNTHSITYQWVYIIIATVISTITLFYYSKAIPEIIPDDKLILEFLMCSGQIFWQGMIILIFINKKIITSYIYNMITISLLGSLMLIPFLIMNQKSTFSVEIRVFYFFVVISIMIIEHIRRIKKLGLPTYLTWT
ncbi:hypothetical protein [Aquimarina sp. 2201CG5-10]|uniref:hypothetical protein n=1 Tax=Aquimarina callyspongiae TaxID=3098150 RepID=UPI002AB3820B|nr:hypothetical protein [Aquimarina sp. 2201CG5-10]MDY8134488.1 hypothetical protein [Aquimarina sp. 2201CG5-10]